jgi:hypothetical protein
MQKLKLSPETFIVLKNFYSINENLFVRAGNVLTTVSQGKTVFARYEAPEVFESDFGIYRLDKLLSVLSLMKEVKDDTEVFPDIKIGPNSLKVSSNGQAATITFADPEVLVYPKKAHLDMPDVDANFTLTEEQMRRALRLGSAMGLPFLAIEGKDGKIFMKALDIDNPTGDTFSVEISGKTNRNFQALFDVVNFKMIPADYKVEIALSGKIKVAKFFNDKMTYWISIHKDSSID